jgi:hypothetical protein
LAGAILGAGFTLPRSFVALAAPNAGELRTESEKSLRIAQLESAYNEVDLSGPRTGVGMTAFLLSGGVTAVGLGAAVRSLENTFLCPPDDPRCGDPSAGSAVIVVLGVAAVIGASVGLALSSRKLKRRKQEWRRIRWEIDELQGSAVGPYPPRPLSH